MTERKAGWWRDYTREVIGDSEGAKTETDAEAYQTFAHRQIRRPGVRERVSLFWQFTKFMFFAVVLSYQLMKMLKPRQQSQK